LNITDLPPNKDVIGLKWFVKLKHKACGNNIERHKARLVAKDYNRQEKVDYFKTLSPVVIKMVIFRLVLGSNCDKTVIFASTKTK